MFVKVEGKVSKVSQRRDSSVFLTSTHNDTILNKYTLTLSPECGIYHISSVSKHSQIPIETALWVMRSRAFGTLKLLDNAVYVGISLGFETHPKLSGPTGSPLLTWWCVSPSTFSPFTSTTRSPDLRPDRSAGEPGSILRMYCAPRLRSPCRWNPYPRSPLVK